VAGAKIFGKQLGNAIGRAKCYNMSDFYSAYTHIHNKIVSGETLN
jgi:hypothetical protein